MTEVSEFERTLLEIEAKLAGVPPAEDWRSSSPQRDRIVERLRTELSEPPIEAQFTVREPSKHYLLIVLAKRYGVQPYRRKRQRETTVLLALPEAFAKEVFAPIFEAMSRAMDLYFLEVTKGIVGRTIDAIPRSDVELPGWTLDE